MPDATRPRAALPVMPAPNANDDARSSRRSLRDLAVLLALPAMWIGHDPSYIVADLLSVLFSLLRLDGAYIRFDDPTGGPALARWRPPGPQVPTEFEPMLTVTPSPDRGVVTVSRAVRSAGATVCVTSMHPALPGADGLVLVSSERTDFPTDLELHLLRVAVGQATISIRAARLLDGERAARATAEAALRTRNAFLATLAQELTLPLTTLSERAAQAHALATEFERPPAPTGPEASQHHQGGSRAGAGPAHSPVDASGLSRPEVVTPSPAFTARLTRREAEVLGLLAHGLSNKEIAAELWLSDRTVERHITGLYGKIGVQRRTEATAFALRHGLLSAHAQEG